MGTRRCAECADGASEDACTHRTVLSVGVVDPTQLAHALGPERWDRLRDRFHASAAGIVQAFEGTVGQRHDGDLLAVFDATPERASHARRACLAVLELQREAADLRLEMEQSAGVSFEIRCGLSSEETDLVRGPGTAALSRQVEQLAPPRSSALTTATAALLDGELAVRELGTFVAEGTKAPQRVLELVGRAPARTRLQALADAGGLTPFLGRVTELGALEWALRQARAGRGRAIGIVGDAGVGKSRLVHELVTGCAQRGIAVHAAHGVADGSRPPLLPVLRLCRDILGADTASDPAAALRALTARSIREPVVVVVEDLHWLDDASEAFFQELLRAVVDARILVLATYRPDYVDAWAEHEPHDRLDLGPLAGQETEDLLTVLLGRDPSLDGLAALVRGRTGGNPLFIEEVVQALAEDGQLTGERGDHQLASEVADLALPPSVEAGIAARIDRLPARARELLETMAVIGAQIPRTLLAEVTELAENELAEALAVLERGRWVLGRGPDSRFEYVFGHPLTQQVAHGSQQPDRRRRRHHEVALAIEATYADTLVERAALLAHHYESALDTAEAAIWRARADGPNAADSHP